MTDTKRLYGDNDKSSNAAAKEEALERLPKTHEIADEIDDAVVGNANAVSPAPGSDRRMYTSRGFRPSRIL
ncbi:MAG: hypothetical protein ABIU09_10955 [Pyrinomonadaceae bacterium]